MLYLRTTYHVYQYRRQTVYFLWFMTQRLNDSGTYSDSGIDFLNGWGRIAGASTGVYELDDVVWGHYAYKPV